MSHKIYGQNVLVINSGSTPETTGNYTVRVIDYDGTVLMTKKGNSGDVISLPDPPSHERLTFQGWSATDTVSYNSVTISNSDIDIGAIYTTASGLNEFDITLTKATGLDVTLNIDGTKDWGDGTSDTETTHTYTSYGNYMITCDGTTITASSSAGLFGQKGNGVNYYLTSVRLSSINSITTYSFQYCYNLKKINIPLEVTGIGDNAFYACRSLTNIAIPDNVTSIRNHVFEYCYNLTSITIPDNVTSIGVYAFSSCSSLTSIIIPDTVTSINVSAFSSCSSLTSVTIPDSATSIGGSAFAYCGKLTSVTIPINVTIISDRMFYNCSSLTSVTIGDSVTSIGSSAFYACRSLMSITIPDSVTSIGESAFEDCKSLTSATIGSGVTSIGERAFNNCNELTSVTIPNNVTSIVNYMFSSCYLLIQYNFSNHTSVPTLSNVNAFTGINGIAKIIVPDALYDEWIAATNWSTYANYIYKASEVTE